MFTADRSNFISFHQLILNITIFAKHGIPCHDPKYFDIAKSSCSRDFFLTYSVYNPTFTIWKRFCFFAIQTLMLTIISYIFKHKFDSTFKYYVCSVLSTWCTLVSYLPHQTFSPINTTTVVDSMLTCKFYHYARTPYTHICMFLI